MSHKKKFITIFLSFLLFSVGVVFYAKMSYVGVCGNFENTMRCVKTLDQFASFVFYFLITLSLVFFILSFLRIQIFQSWKKFAQIFIPISIILVILAPEHANKGFDGIGYGLDKEQTTWWLSGIFLVMSLVVIVYNNLKLKKQK